MRNFTRTITAVVVTLAAFFLQKATAQSVLDPNDPIVTYNSASPPTQPAYGQIGKWVRTPRLNWNTSSYKCYIYKGVAFRLKFPKTYNPTAVDGKKYPMMIFFHGLGESGTIYDNEYQLYHGGDYFRTSVDNGTFDGYIIAMQTLTQNGGWWAEGHFDMLKEIIEYMIVNNKLDPFRVMDNGLSAGGSATWDMLIKYPQYIAGAVPMSSAAAGRADAATVNKVKFTPMWVTHGGLDNNPTPYDANLVKTAMVAAGANYKDQLYPDLGHGTWESTWHEADFWPFMKRAYASNPWPLQGRVEFCPGESFNVTLGLASGFDAYEWRKDGVVISGATTNTIQVTELGTYEARVQRNGTWSSWSPKPVVFKLKAATVSPAIQLTNNVSKVIPSLDGSTGVQLEVPAGYTSYEWQKEGSTTVIGTTRFLNATTGGDYKVKVAEPFTCTSVFSPLFHVVDANGPNKPDAAINLVATTLSNSSLRLDWSDNPTPQYNETGFEVYQATQAGGPYKYIGLTATDIRKYTITGLVPNTKYFYKVRAINNTGAATPSNEASAVTLTDSKAPSTPELTVTNVTPTTVSLAWTPATDDGGVSRYEIFVNGAKSYVTDDTDFTISNAVSGVPLVITVAARDLANNLSAQSNQVSVTPSLGLTYKYYTYTGSWTALPNFSSSTLVPAATGRMSNVFLTPRTVEDRFAFLWEGYIEIPVTGAYYFRTNSDDGSRLWLGALNGTSSPYSYSGTPTINNDGLHSGTDKTSAILNLTAGVYPIAIAYYEETGSQGLTLTWKTPLTGSNFVAIPNMAFVEMPGGTPPAKPSNLQANPVSYKRIDLSWTDNSSNETGFEIFRSTLPFSSFQAIGKVGAGVTSYQDNGLSANVKYYYRVRAVNQYGESDFDLAGQGVDYIYFQQTGLTALPSFAGTPVKSGHLTNFDLGSQEQADNFQYKFSSVINIPADGVYTFYLRSDEGSKLYLDGFDAAHTVINSDGIHTVSEKSASLWLAKGAHPIYVTYFEVSGVEDLQVSISSPEIVKKKIPNDMLGVPLVNATTPASAIAPTKPANLVASGQSTSVISLTWQDKSNNEKAFEVYRSSGNNTSYVLTATLPANSTTYTDAGLFTNAVFYYKVRAVGDVNNSGYTNEDSAKTYNILPVMGTVLSRTVRFGVTTVIPLVATDADGDPLTITSGVLPPFATLVDNGNKTGTLTLNPTSSQLGVYPILLVARDNHNGADSIQFNLTVNSNNSPSIGSISNYTVTENTSLNVPLSATDAEGQAITWSVSNLPSAFSVVPGSGGNATLQLNPTATASGVYTVIVNATDAAGGVDTKTFQLTVNDGAPASPDNLNARYAFGTGVTLTWNDLSSTETGFQVLRSLSPSGPFAPVATINFAGANTYVDNTAAANTQYYYVVAALTANDRSGNSNVASVFTNRIPQIGALAPVLVKNNQPASVDITATDDASDVITLSASGLPSFASLRDNGNGTGSISINPNAGSTGVYTITVIAKDKYDSTSSTTFELSVTDKEVSSVYVNFTDGSVTAGKPWNNLQAAHLTGFTASNLLDDSYANSGMSVKMVSGWDFTNATGMQGVGGKELFPNAVMKNAMQNNSASAKRIEIAGLSASRKYNIVFFASYNQDSYPNGQGQMVRETITNFSTVMPSPQGTQTVSLNPKFDVNKSVQINGISPDANGKIYIDVAKGATSDFGLLSALIIQSYPSATTAPISPANLQVVSTTRNSATLQWQDRSDEASTDAFEVYRSSGGSAYSKIATLGQNATSYTDAGLNPGTTYSYSVRARKGTTNFSPYSNVAVGTTSSYTVSINFNYTSDGQAAAPWNNTDLEPLETGHVWSNFADDLGQTTSIGMVNTGVWNGPANGGRNTTNNSGAVPDKVLLQAYGVFPGITAFVKVTGLNIARKYNITFSTSISTYDDVTAKYTVNGKWVYLTPSFNAAGTATICDLTPDEWGQLNISVSCPPGSLAAFIGAMIIQEVNPSTVVPPTPSEKIQTTLVQANAAIDNTSGEVKAYPNPYRETLLLSVPAEQGEEVTISVYDLSGKLMLQSQHNQLNRGLNAVQVKGAGRLQPGTYLVKLRYNSRPDAATVKVIKL